MCDILICFVDGHRLNYKLLIVMNGAAGAQAVEQVVH